MDIKSLHTPVKMAGFCGAKKWDQDKSFRTFSTFNVNYNLYNSIKNKLKYFRKIIIIICCGAHKCAHPLITKDMAVFRIKQSHSNSW